MIKNSLIVLLFILVVSLLISSGCVQLPTPPVSTQTPPASSDTRQQESKPAEVEEQAGPELEQLPKSKTSPPSEPATPPASELDQQIKVKYTPQPDTIRVMKDALATGKPILIDFWAVWCGPCKQLKPIIKDLEATYSGKMVFLEIDVDDQEGSKLADEFKVQFIPDIVVMNADHEIIYHFQGFADKATLESAIKAALGA